MSIAHTLSLHPGSCSPLLAAALDSVPVWPKGRCPESLAELGVSRTLVQNRTAFLAIVFLRLPTRAPRCIQSLSCCRIPVSNNPSRGQDGCTKTSEQTASRERTYLILRRATNRTYIAHHIHPTVDDFDAFEASDLETLSQHSWSIHTYCGTRPRLHTSKVLTSPHGPSSTYLSHYLTYLTYLGSCVDKSRSVVLDIRRRAVHSKFKIAANSLPGYALAAAPASSNEASACLTFLAAQTPLTAPNPSSPKVLPEHDREIRPESTETELLEVPLLSGEKKEIRCGKATLSCQDPTQTTPTAGEGQPGQARVRPEASPEASGWSRGGQAGIHL
ncbi:hypothetical protein F4780DRAFT_611837 [Xylariomycetidae sp. FL0641]|nr:hypothetical protein F4780DRAFT_611837 [Xylariomycetidae sp. FL0641]